ncbi:sensor histidine kinase [Streptomyces sp. NPDC059909]|uniref:sensor histidine kinase n=1 Tax=Streptomyces sp. NPDC059909 TaxID=3346998 RepID=UPI00364AE563
MGVRDPRPRGRRCGVPRGADGDGLSPRPAPGPCPGIPEADLPYVFDRFYRSPAARSLPGSGLGLAIVRQVAETYGGSVAAEPLERGLRMRLSLPALAG